VFWIDLGYTSPEKGGIVVWFYLEKAIDLKKEGINIEYSTIKWFEEYKQFGITFDKIVDLTPLTDIIKRSYVYMTE
jgi:hypothetical protein